MFNYISSIQLSKGESFKKLKEKIALQYDENYRPNLPRKGQPKQTWNIHVTYTQLTILLQINNQNMQ